MDIELELPFSRMCRVLVHTDKKARPRAVVLALHGYGQSADLMQRSFQGSGFGADLLWVIPDGILPFERRSTPDVAYSWYLFAQRQDLLRQTMEAAASYLDQVLARVQALQASEGLPQLPLFVLGFSQGAYLAGYYAGTRQSKVRGAACACGRIKHEFFSDTLSQTPAPRFLQLVGERDTSISLATISTAVEKTRARGYHVEMRVFAGVEHELHPDMQHAFLEWMGGLI